MSPERVAREGRLETSGSAPPSLPDRAVAGVAGAASLLLALALLHLAWRAIPFAPLAALQTIVRLIPGRIDTFFIERLGKLTLPLAAAAAAATILAVGALLGTFAGRSIRARGGRSYAGATYLPLWAGWSLLYRPGPYSLSRMAFAAATLAAPLVGGWVLHRGMRSSGHLSEGTQAIPDRARRRLLVALGVGAAGFALGASDLGSLLGGRANRFRPIHLPKLTPVSPPHSSTGDAAFGRLAGLTPRITPISDFYVVDQAIVDPAIDASEWHLQVGGLVRRPSALSYDDLLQMPAVERFQTMECISNPVGGDLISTARWEGVPLAEILDRAGVQSGAVEVVFRSADGYSDSLPLSQAMDERTLIALGMDGFELPQSHGFPARLLSLGTFGMKNPKWLTSIEVVGGPYEGFWEVRGWSKRAAVKTTSRFDLPQPGTAIRGPAPIGGIAFSGDRGISRVEVSTDAGKTWGRATLESPVSPYTWVRWLYRWTAPTPGTYTLRARAFDVEGVPQPAAWAPPHPDGASSYPVIAVRVLSV